MTRSWKLVRGPATRSAASKWMRAAAVCAHLKGHQPADRQQLRFGLA